MGSSISAIYDDYDDYEYFCKTLGVEIISINGNSKYSSFYVHEQELLDNLGFKHLSDYYAALRKAENRDKQIDNILND
jgi:hypothetical protein